MATPPTMADRDPMEPAPWQPEPLHLPVGEAQRSRRERPADDDEGDGAVDDGRGGERDRALERRVIVIDIA